MRSTVIGKMQLISTLLEVYAGKTGMLMKAYLRSWCSLRGVLEMIDDWGLLTAKSCFHIACKTAWWHIEAGCQNACINMCVYKGLGASGAQL